MPGFGDNTRARLALPDPPPALETARPAEVDKTASVRFDRILYSVPRRSRTIEQQQP